MYKYNTIQWLVTHTKSWTIQKLCTLCKKLQDKQWPIIVSGAKGNATNDTS